MQTIKCVVVGDYTVGKTSLLIRYKTNESPVDYGQNMYATHVLAPTIDGEPYTLFLFDTAFQEGYDRLRPLSYPQTDVFLVFFSVVSSSSFENVREKWIPEISHYCPKTPYILVGTKIDLCDDPSTLTGLQEKNENPITFEQGEKLAREIKAMQYLECSAKTEEGVKNVFAAAVMAALNSKVKCKTKKRKCICL